MFFLRQLKKFRVNKTILTQFYQAAIESVLTFSITVWFGSASIHNKNMHEGIVKTASNIPRAISVLTLGNKVILYCNYSLIVLLSPEK